jgi:uncharacterized membrane protein YhaH (DUF805 family)
MTDAAWITVIVLGILLLIVFISWTATLCEMRCRSRELTKVVAPHEAPEAVDWWTLLHSIVILLEPLPPANTTKLQKSLTNLRKLVPTKEI